MMQCSDKLNALLSGVASLVRGLGNECGCVAVF